MNKIYQKTLLTILMAAVFYSTEAAGPAPFLHASHESMKAVSRKGLPLEMVISAEELRQKQLKKRNFVLFDARSEKSYGESHIQGALLPRAREYYQQENLFKKGISRHEPNSDEALSENLRKYSKNTPIYTYCSSGGCQASAVLALQIKRLGFKDVRAMEDGIQTWGQKGYPIESSRQRGENR